MQFIFDGKGYKAIKITGPAHNFLGLVFDECKKSEIEIIQLKGIDNEKMINYLDVKEQVFAGIEEVNRKLGVNYNVKQIQFIPSDTPSKNVYKELTIEIINRLFSGVLLKKS